MTAKNRADFKAAQATAFADNATGDITAADLRQQMGDLADSAVFPDDTAMTNAATAYGWGDHAAAGYLTGYTVTEGDVIAHQAALSLTKSQISDMGANVESDPGTTGGSSITNVISLTQAQYDAIGTPDAATLYVIEG